MLRSFTKKPDFKLRFQKDMIVPACLYGTMILCVIFLSPVVHLCNAFTIGNCVMMVYMSLGNDYSVKIKENTIYFSILHLSLGMIAWIATFHLAFKVIAFFVVIMYLAYYVNRGRRKSMYNQFIMNFVFYVYFPAYGSDLVVRLIIIEASTVAMMMCQYLFNRYRFRVTTRAQLRAILFKIEDYADDSVRGISKEKNEELFTEADDAINELGTSLFNKYTQVNQWERGPQYLRILSMLEDVNRLIYHSNKNKLKLHEKTHEKIKSLVAYIDEFDLDKDNYEDLIAEFAQLRIHSEDSLSDETIFESQMDSYVEIKEENAEILERTHESDRLDRVRFIYALKTALIASLGILVINFFGFQYEYWFPINVCILSQPFYDFNRSKSKSRIFNTVIATSILFFAFNLTNLLWLQILILVALVILGNVVFKLDFFSIYASFMSLILGYVNGRGTIVDLSILRLLYVVITSAIVLGADALFAPRTIRATFVKNLEQAEAYNKLLMAALLDSDCAGAKIKEIMKRKIDLNHYIFNLRQYYITKDLDAFFIIEDEIYREYLAVYDYLIKNEKQSCHVKELFLTTLETGDMEFSKDRDSQLAAFAVYEMYDMYEAAMRSNELIVKLIEGLKEEQKEKKLKGKAL